MNNKGFLFDNAHFLLRFVIASVFLFHGVGKLVDVGGFAQMMGMHIGVAWLVTLAEVLGGLGIIVGAFLRNDLVTRLAGAAIVPVMAGAIALVHWPRWSFTPSESHPMGGMEFQVSLLLIGLYFAIVGNAKAATQ
ncbi:MAG: DoxX family protein [Gammaproteobacteria bacterium]|nr:DoxX family protein [Gammaproteobacteria bacterium]